MYVYIVYGLHAQMVYNSLFNKYLFWNTHKGDICFVSACVTPITIDNNPKFLENIWLARNSEIFELCPSIIVVITIPFERKELRTLYTDLYYPYAGCY